MFPLPSQPFPSEHVSPTVCVRYRVQDTTSSQTLQSGRRKDKHTQMYMAHTLCWKRASALKKTERREGERGAPGTGEGFLWVRKSTLLGTSKQAGVSPVDSQGCRRREQHTQRL